jgi:glycosyltransferase involved in cell wall biosynthesis
MIGRPLVSFVIPVRNDAHRLHVCLESIKANDYPSERVQIVVVDNGSIDDSACVARQAGATVISVPDACVSVLRNRGAACATGDVLAFVDADHTICPDWIRSAVALLSRDDTVAAGSPYTSPPYANWVQRHYDLLRNHPQSCVDVEWLGAGNLAIKRAVFERIGGFDQSLEACEDVDLCIRARASGRLVSSPQLRSVHFGDPSTLLALFVGELWRGRNNLRVTLRAPFNWRTMRSALVPVAALLAVVLGVVCLVSGWYGVGVASMCVLPLLAALRTTVMAARDSRKTARRTVRSFAVAVVYDAARALAILARTPHQVRRAVDPVSHVTANSRT